MAMPSTPGPFACAISSQVRMAMAEHRVSGAKLAAMIGRSQSYMSTRLRNEGAFSADDVEAICNALGEDLLGLLRDAVIASRRR